MQSSLSLVKPIPKISNTKLGITSKKSEEKKK